MSSPKQTVKQSKQHMVLCAFVFIDQNFGSSHTGTAARVSSMRCNCVTDTGVIEIWKSNLMEHSTFQILGFFGGALQALDSDHTIYVFTHV